MNRVQYSNHIIARGDLEALSGHTVEGASGDCRYPRDDDAINNVHSWGQLVPSVPHVNNSKYLKPAQQLLDEFVHVGKAAGSWSDGLFCNDTFTGVAKKIGGWPLQLEHAKLAESTVICHNPRSPEQNSVSNTKIKRLLALLDELDSRYEQYCRRIDEVISSFEAVTGIGAANSYTGLAVRAMSRHFFNLRAAIISQICASREPILEDLNRKSASPSREPSLSERRTKQNNKTLRKLAVIQVQQVWRPLRGLPANSAAVLRTWLFEHFLHPYPNDNEKQVLASKTGLSRNQISNWFINARVRLWKPMIEEMYREEFAKSSCDSNPSS